MSSNGYERLVTSVAGVALAEALKRGNEIDVTIDDALTLSTQFADAAIDMDGVFQDPAVERKRMAVQMMAALLPLMPHSNPFEIARRAVKLVDALNDVMDFENV